MALGRHERVAWLERVPLFGGCDPQLIGEIADLTGEQTFADGQVIVRQGQVGNGLYIIVSGAVRIVGGTTELERMGPGDFFGELSVIDREPRSATVVAEGSTSCLALASWDLDELLARSPRLAQNLLRGLAGRLRRADARLRD
jgi:CRP-like cAMP-binding protein